MLSLLLPPQQLHHQLAIPHNVHPLDPSQRLEPPWVIPAEARKPHQHVRYHLRTSELRGVVRDLRHVIHTWPEPFAVRPNRLPLPVLVVSVKVRTCPPHCPWVSIPLAGPVKEARHAYLLCLEIVPKAPASAKTPPN